MRKPRFGPCHLCGQHSKLSFEHVPPRAAFNDRPILYAEIEKLLDRDPSQIRWGRKSQRGAGAFTLCERCNNQTGRWYGRSFAEWALQGMRIVNITKEAERFYFPFYIYPLRVLKQIVCMFFSTVGPNFQTKHPELVRFALNKERNYLDTRFRFYTFYNLSRRSRQTGIVGKADLENRAISIFSEITFPPFGYVMTINTVPPDDRLYEITHFSRRKYDEREVVPLRLSVLPVYDYFPADYRTKDEIDKLQKNNR